MEHHEHDWPFKVASQRIAAEPKKAEKPCLCGGANCRECNNKPQAVLDKQREEQAAKWPDFTSAELEPKVEIIHTRCTKVAFYYDGIPHDSEIIQAARATYLDGSKPGKHMLMKCGSCGFFLTRRELKLGQRVTEAAAFVEKTVAGIATAIGVTSAELKADPKEAA